jgi:hypothetical protein
MNAKYTRPLLESVNLRDIDRENDLFSMSFEPDLGRLRSSVQQIGVLAPIWLRRKGPKLQIINGFRRFDVVRALGETEVRALIWEEEVLDDRSAFEMSLHENVLTRALNIAEKAIVVGKLLDDLSVSRDEVVRIHLPLVGLEPHEGVLNTFQVINTFTPEVKRYVVSRSVSLANTGLLGKFSIQEQEVICRFLSPLRLGENVLREILTFVREICLRDHTEMERLISDRSIRDILSDPRLSGPQKVQSLRGALRKKRYPQLSNLEARFKRWRNGVTLRPHVRISPPPFFEGDRFKVEFSFEGPDDYEAVVEELRNLSHGPVLELLTIKGYDADAH